MRTMRHSAPAKVRLPRALNFNGGRHKATFFPIGCHQRSTTVEAILFSKLLNIGKASSQMLLAAGIRSEEQLRDMGAVAAFIAVKAAGYTPSLNLLWAIEGALTNQDWKIISRNDRTSLLFQLDDFERGHG